LDLVSEYNRQTLRQAQDRRANWPTGQTGQRAYGAAGPRAEGSGPKAQGTGLKVKGLPAFGGLDTGFWILDACPPASGLEVRGRRSEDNE